MGKEFEIILGISEKMRGEEKSKKLQTSIKNQMTSKGDARNNPINKKIVLREW